MLYCRVENLNETVHRRSLRKSKAGGFI